MEQLTQVKEFRNRLLAALSKTGNKGFAESLEEVKLASAEVLYAPGKTIDYIYFPQNVVVSLVTEMSDSTSLEIGVVGHEGVVGLPLFLGVDRVNNRAIVQVAGTALRMRAADFREEAEKDRDFHRLLHRYTQALFTQVVQSASCNRLHRVENRCSRWLLMVHTQAGRDNFMLTQEFLSQMLAVRRASVQSA
ncbi:MAG TPA: Crp/Fnr family transcriptional regulator, partial [Chloroflexia bacterium]|nr:Crp/Fnr family transcriptional regulator [Chloroflexia bacterium]